jgi:hypothetical protein
VPILQRHREGNEVNVAVLGSGPAGLMSAWACIERGLVPTIYTKDRYPSLIRGAQYLHEPIPGVTDMIPVTAVTYLKRGTAEGYAWKVYRDHKRKTSWNRWPQGIVNAWPLKEAYKTLWKHCDDLIWDGVAVDADFLDTLLKQNHLIISTIPPTSYCCNEEHRFETSRTWIVEEDNNVPPDTIIYDGDRYNSAHRLSHLEGKRWSEYAMPLYGAAEVAKPQATDCNCFPEVLRVGRFGLWRRDVLTTDAYNDTKDKLNAILS